MIIQEIFRVLYSPLKAFEEIAKAPNVKGPLFILLITLLASAGAQYMGSSKILLETEKDSDAYIPLTATDMINDRLILALTDAMFSFCLNWLIYGATFLLVLKLFRTKESPWYQLFILIGYTFVVAAVFVIARAILITTFPTIKFDFDMWTKAFLEGDAEAQNLILLEYEKTWASLPAFQILSYSFFAVEVWTAALGAVAIHFLREVSWNRALIISAIVYAISLFLRFPLIF